MNEGITYVEEALVVGGVAQQLVRLALVILLG